MSALKGNATIRLWKVEGFSDSGRNIFKEPDVLELALVFGRYLKVELGQSTKEPTLNLGLTQVPLLLRST